MLDNRCHYACCCGSHILKGEVGEVCEIFQWKRFLESEDPADRDTFTEKETIHIGEEIADVFIYSTRLCDVCNIDLAFSVRDLIDDDVDSGIPPSTAGPFSPSMVAVLSNQGGCNDALRRPQQGDSWRSFSFKSLASCTADMSQTFRSQRQIVLSLQKQAGKMCELFSDRPESYSAAGLPGWPRSDIAQLASLAASMCILLSCLAQASGLSITQCVSDKFAKNEAKYPVDLVRGKSSKYTAYADAVAARNVLGDSNASIAGTTGLQIGSLDKAFQAMKGFAHGRKGVVLMICISLLVGYGLGTMSATGRTAGVV